MIKGPGPEFSLSKWIITYSNLIQIRKILVYSELKGDLVFLPQHYLKKIFKNSWNSMMIQIMRKALF